MPTPRTRRALLTSVVPLALCLTGCFEGRLTSADESATDDVESTTRDCADVERPEPEPPARDDAIQPGTYPSPSASALEDPVAYVLEFEETYRRNALLEAFGTDARAFDFRSARWEEDRLEEGDDDAALVSVVYRVDSRIERHGDHREYNTRVTYYVDEGIVLRARYSGLASEPSFEPDPREAGDLVACLE